jgi:hypothetical protein
MSSLSTDRTTVGLVCRKCSSCAAYQTGSLDPHAKLYLWIDRVKLDRIGKRPQQTLTMGGRDRTIETTATRSI